MNRPYRCAATTKLRRNAADGLFTKPSIPTFSVCMFQSAIPGRCCLFSDEPSVSGHFPNFILNFASCKISSPSSVCFHPFRVFKNASPSFSHFRLLHFQSLKSGHNFLNLLSLEIFDPEQSQRAV